MTAPDSTYDTSSGFMQELDALDAQVDRFEAEYEALAETKSGIQKGMDGVRSWFNRGEDGEGYGDDQWKNIGNTRHEMEQIQADVRSGRIDEEEGKQRLDELQQDFESEARRVDEAQEGNAEKGEMLHGFVRGLTVSTAAGFSKKFGGPAFSAAVAAGVGGRFDQFTVVAGALDRAMGNGPKEGEESHFTPELEVDGSFMGLFADSVLNGRSVDLEDVMNATKGTAMDAVTGVFAHLGPSSMAESLFTPSGNKLAQVGTEAAEMAFKEALATLGVDVSSTLADPTLDLTQKYEKVSQQVAQAIMELPATLFFSAASDAGGEHFKQGDEMMDAIAQMVNKVITGIAHSLTNDALTNEEADPGMTAADETLVAAG